MKLHVYPPLRCFHSLYDFIAIANVKTENFDRFFNNWLGHKEFLCTYQGRTGLYHILKYLKRNFNIRRVIIPSYICKIVIPPIKMNGLEVIFVDNNLETLGMDSNRVSLKNNDVVLWVNYFGLKSKPSEKLLNRKDIFIIEDNASHFQKPSSFADFTLYSFGKGKEMSSSEGSVVVVNKSKFKNFLDEVKLDPPSFKTEVIRFFKYLTWRLVTFRLVYMIGKRIKNALQKNHGLNPVESIENVNFSMCKVSKKLIYRNLIKINKLQKYSKVLAELLIKRLKNINGISVLNPKGDSNYFSVNFLVDKRNSLKLYLERKNIFGSIPWEYLAEYDLNKKSHKNASYILKHILQIKIDPTYMRTSDIDYIARNIEDWTISTKRTVLNSRKSF